MRRTCQYWVLNDEGKEVPCGKPGVAYIIWPGEPKGDIIYWYCAEHFDIRFAEVRDAPGVAKASGF